MLKFKGMKLYRLVMWQLTRAYIRLLPTSIKMPTHDRIVLEQIIFREIFICGRYHNILFVGVSQFTSWYPSLFRPWSRITFWTIDPDLQKQLYGSKTHHLVARFETLVSLHEAYGLYDLVIVNGVFNYGIDTPDNQVAALNTAHAILKSGGKLLIGYRAFEGKPDLDLASVNREKFTEGLIPGLTCWHYLTKSNNCHTFVCFVKL